MTPHVLLINRIWLLLLCPGWLGGDLMAQELVARNHYPVSQPHTVHQKTTKSLEQVLDQLKKQYNVNFAYERRVLEGKTVETAEINNPSADVEAVLQRVLPPLRLRFIKVNDVYIIQPQKPKTAPLEKIRSALPNGLNPSSGTSSDAMLGVRTRQQRSLAKQWQQTITGTVTDQSTGEGLPGVNIVAKGTTIGTVTDIDGNYRLNAPDDASILVFSSVGYTTQEINIGGRSVISTQMEPDVQSLSEVVVVGYGTQKKSDIVGSVASVSSEKLEQNANPNVFQAMQGAAPGLNIQRGSGEPGTSGSIQIRGLNSISASKLPM